MRCYCVYKNFMSSFCFFALLLVFISFFFYFTMFYELHLPYLERDGVGNFRIQFL